jgi:beta-galactosidase
VQDKAGLTVPRSKNHLTFNIAGPGEIVGVDNGDPTCLDAFRSKEHDAFNGLCLVIVRSTGPGNITLEATSPDLKAGQVKIQAYGATQGDFGTPGGAKGF